MAFSYQQDNRQCLQLITEMKIRANNLMCQLLDETEGTSGLEETNNALIEFTTEMLIAFSSNLEVLENVILKLDGPKQS